jgi:hypothetical protein
MQQPQVNKASISGTPNLTCHKLQQSDAWPEWLAAEHIQLDNYHTQGMFGTPTVPPPNLAIFYWVWVYKIKEMEDNRKKAHAVCDGSTCGGAAHISGHTFAPTPDMIDLCLDYKSHLLLNVDLPCITLMDPMHLPKLYVRSKCTTCVLMHHFVNGGILVSYT